MTFRNEDIAVRSERHRIGLVEETGSRSCDSRRAQLHQYFSLGRKLEYLMAPAILALSVGDPHVAIRIDANTVGHHQQAAAKVVQNFPGLIELEDGVQLGTSAGRCDKTSHA